MLFLVFLYFYDETMGRKNNCKLNFFSMAFVRNIKEINFSFKNSEKQWTQALRMKHFNTLRADSPIHTIIHMHVYIYIQKNLPYPFCVILG